MNLASGIRGLRPEKLFSIQVFVISLLWMALLHFLDIQNNIGFTNPIQRMLVLFIAHAITFSLLLAPYFLLRNKLSQKSLTLLLVIAVVVVSPVRGFAFFYLLRAVVGRDAAPLALRVSGSLTNLSFAIIVAWIGISAVETHRIGRQRLIEERQQLLLMRHEVKSRLESMDVESAEQIRRNLLDEIQNNSEFTSPQVAASLRRLIDDVVRPLSRYFEQQTDGWMPPDPPKQLLQIDWRNAALNSFNAKYIQPFLLIALMLWISLTNTILHRGLVVGLMAIVHGMVFAIPLFILIRNRAIQLSRSQNRLKQGLIFFASLYIGGQIFGLTTWVYAGWEQPFYYYSKMGPFYVIAGGSLIAFAQSVIEESRSIEAVLIQSGEDLRWSLARSRESHRQQRRALAHALHGQIQAALASAVLRLEISAHSSEQDSKIVESIVDSLKASILNVQLLDAKSETLDVVLDRIRDTWSGIAKIEAHIEPGVLELLHADQTCAVALNDVLTELTYNSIKHGSASAIEIHLSLKDSRSLTVLVSDNGSAPTNSASRGLGSALLDDCAISWNRIRKADRTMSEVLLPLEVAEPISV